MGASSSEVDDDDDEPLDPVRVNVTEGHGVKTRVKRNFHTPTARDEVLGSASKGPQFIYQVPCDCLVRVLA